MLSVQWPKAYLYVMHINIYFSMVQYHHIIMFFLFSKYKIYVALIPCSLTLCEMQTPLFQAWLILLGGHSNKTSPHKMYYTKHLNTLTEQHNLTCQKAIVQMFQCARGPNERTHRWKMDFFFTFYYQMFLQHNRNKSLFFLSLFLFTSHTFRGVSWGTRV